MRLFFRNIYRGLRSLFGHPAPFNVVVVDDIPEQMNPEVLYLAEEDGDYWLAVMECPCGCSSKIQLSLLPTDKPKWSVSVHSNGTASLQPSVWRTVGCKSHFWFRRGHVIWCQS